MKKIYLISNDKIWKSKKNFFTSNNDLNNILSCLVTEYDVHLICRKSVQKFNFLISEKFNFFKKNKEKDEKMNVLMISITPYNFFSLLKLYLSGEKITGYVFLRSDGFLEYKIKYGVLGYFFYFFMFYIISKKLKILSVSKKFTNVKIKRILHPSELNKTWLKKNKKINKFKIDFLYVGRFKREKGSYFLAKIFKENLTNYNLTIVGTKKKFIEKKYYAKNINYIGPVVKSNKLIKLYDSARIFILPSFTEGYPKVVSESLARFKPIIIFKEIEHIVNRRKGIFVCKREIKNIKKIFKFILRNYRNIQKTISKNYIYTKEDFKRELLSSIRNEFNK